MAWTPHRQECPKCSLDISDSYNGYDPDCGIMESSWYCEACDFHVIDDYEPDCG